MSASTVSSRRAYTGKVINLDVDVVRFPDGSTGELEIIRHPGASAVVPMLGDVRGEDPPVLLIRQYRYAADDYLYEIPAGRLEPQEEPEVCARRELLEETGCTATRMDHLFTMLTTPGFTDERIHVYLASGLVRGQPKREADEFMTTEVVPLSRALTLIEQGALNDAKSALALLYVAGFRANA
ncbi:MAG TPA: NUDIX hydrolase [Gemmatimonadaceae bacterium]|nr:NUDIX hydrolase [Gemmatimonadaceae bacterium]